MGNTIEKIITVPNYSLLQGSWWLTADYQHWDLDTKARHVFTYCPEHSGLEVKVLKYYDDKIEQLDYYLHCDANGVVNSMTMGDERHHACVRYTDGVNILILEGVRACGDEFMSIYTRDQNPSGLCFDIVEKVLGPCDSWRKLNKAPGAFDESTSFHIGLNCTFNAKLYSGKWWEAGRYPLTWEKSCVRSQADYTANVKTGQMFVTNYCFNEYDDLLDKRSGTAETVGEGHFSLVFDDGRESSGAAAYVVAWTDYENYAIVGCMGRDKDGRLIHVQSDYNADDASSSSCDTDSAVIGKPKTQYIYGWLLSRKKQIPDIEKNWLCAKLAECGYKPGKMLWASGLMI